MVKLNMLFFSFLGGVVNVPRQSLSTTDTDNPQDSCYMNLVEWPSSSPISYHVVY